MKLLERTIRNIKSPVLFLDWLLYQHAHEQKNSFFLITMNHGGTHWLRMLLAKALVDAYKLNEQPSDIKNFSLIPPYHRKQHRFEYNGHQGIPRIQQAHTPYDPIHFKNKNVILLVRDLRDVMVSYYRSKSLHHDLDISFSEFLQGTSAAARNFPHTLENRVAFLNSWNQGQQSASRFLLMRYEDLKANPKECLREAIEFMEFPSVTNEFLETCVEYASIENMQKLEREVPSVKRNGMYQKIATGTVGRYREFYSQSDKDFFMSIVEKNLVNSYGYDYSNW